MESYESFSAGLDTDVDSTIQYWTGAGDATPFVEEFEGSFHMREAIREDPTNILYMLYPNGESGQYPYPAEYEPYSLQIVDDPIPASGPSTPANNGARTPSRRGAQTSSPSPKGKRPYVRRTKPADATTPDHGSSSNSSVAGPSSQTKKSQRPTTPRKTRSPASLNLIKHTSLCKVPSPLKQGFTQPPSSPVPARHRTNF